MNLHDIHEQVLAHIRDHFGGRLATVDAYLPERADPLTTPAALLDIEGWSEGEDSGTGQLALNLDCAVHCLLSFRTPDVAREVRAFAAELHGLLRDGVPALAGVAGRPRRLEVMPGLFKPGQDGYEDMVVVFELPVWLGENVWAGGVTPHEVWLGIEPETGPEHIDDYVQVASEADLPEAI